MYWRVGWNTTNQSANGLKSAIMQKIDIDKIDELTLALLYLVTDAADGRAWKSFDWETMNRLHDKGLITDPRSKAKSVVLSEKALILSKKYFYEHFGF
jgi:hypothetical protein